VQETNVGSGALTRHGYPWISGRGTPPAPTHPTPTLRIGRWGNVLAVRLPQGLCNLLRLQRGDTLDLQLLRSGQLLLTPRPRRSRLALCEALQAAADQR
jgi:antitoxin component of MazEF toxin-antitoxin module